MNESTFVSEQRQSPRKLFSWRARIMSSDKTFVDCRTIDQSNGGLGLICPKPFEIGESIQIAVQSPDEATGTMRVIVHQGYVAMSVLTRNGYRVGVRLGNTMQELLDVIESQTFEAAES